MHKKEVARAIYFLFYVLYFFFFFLHLYLQPSSLPNEVIIPPLPLLLSG